jgi:hypothetical protein
MSRVGVGVEKAVVGAWDSDSSFKMVEYWTETSGFITRLNKGCYLLILIVLIIAVSVYSPRRRCVGQTADR